MIKYNSITTSSCPVVWWVRVLFLVFFMAACKHSVNEIASEAIPLQHIEKATLNAENIFFLLLSKIETSDKTSDSLLVVWDNEKRTVHYLDTSLTLVHSLKLPSGVSDIKAFDYFNNNYFLLTEKDIKVYDNNLSQQLKSFSFDFSDADGFATIGFDFKILSDSSFYLLRFPQRASIVDSQTRSYYFNSKLIVKMGLRSDSLLMNEPLNISFPEQYRQHFFNDVHPQFYPIENAYAYTFGHWDSLAILSAENVERYAIPKPFSVQSEPFSIESMSSVTKSKEYSATNTSNINLFNYKNKIVLFQRIAAKSYVDEETGMINDYIVAAKRAVVFDMDTKKFEKDAYALPSNSNPIKIIIFNDKLHLLSTDDARQKVHINQIELN